MFLPHVRNSSGRWWSSRHHFEVWSATFLVYSPASLVGTVFGPCCTMWRSSLLAKGGLQKLFGGGHDGSLSIGWSSGLRSCMLCGLVRHWLGSVWDPLMSASPSLPGLSDWACAALQICQDSCLLRPGRVSWLHDEPRQERHRCNNLSGDREPKRKGPCSKVRALNTDLIDEVTRSE